jgi:sortase A
MMAVTARRVVGFSMVVAGLTALCWCAVVLTRAEYLRVEQRRTLPAVEVAPGRGQPLGIIELPRLHLSSVVVEGDDSSSLLVAAAHLSDTPLPWQGGNTVLAGHRDTDFRPLRGVKSGDVIHFLTADARFDYVVTDTRIVGPTDVSVLRASNEPTLTLITCYPFNFVGPAPSRFVVRAERVPRGPET